MPSSVRARGVSVTAKVRCVPGRSRKRSGGAAVHELAAGDLEVQRPGTDAQRAAELHLGPLVPAGRVEAADHVERALERLDRQLLVALRARGRLLVEVLDEEAAREERTYRFERQSKASPSGPRDDRRVAELLPADVTGRSRERGCRAGRRRRRDRRGPGRDGRSAPRMSIGTKTSPPFGSTATPARRVAVAAPAVGAVLVPVIRESVRHGHAGRRVAHRLAAAQRVGIRMVVQPVMDVDHAVAVRLAARQRLVGLAHHDRVAGVVRADLLGDPGRRRVVAGEMPPLIREARDEARQLGAGVAVLADGVEQGRQDVDPPAADRDRLRGRERSIA